MKVKVVLRCTYYRASGELVGVPGKEVELSESEAAPLLKGGSAVLAEELKPTS